jgi:hypothetical protein
MASISIPEIPAGFYVYAISVSDVVRYVGKGCGDRIREHFRTVRRLDRDRASGRSVRTSKFYNRLAKALGEGRPVRVDLLASGLDEPTALAVEVEEIARRGALWNVYPGGVGFSSAYMKERWRDADYRAKRSEQSKANWRDPAYRANQNERRRSPEHAQAASKALRDALSDPAVRQKMSDRKRAFLADQNNLAAHKKRVRASSERPEVRHRNSEAQKTRWADPAHRAKMREIHINSRAGSAWREGQSRRAKAQQTPEARKRTSEHLKALWRDPIFKAEQLARRRAKRG